MPEIPDDKEDAQVIELFLSPVAEPYALAAEAGLSPEEEKVLLMRGLLQTPESGDPLTIVDPTRGRRVEGTAVITSLKSIELAALAAIQGKRKS